MAFPQRALAVEMSTEESIDTKVYPYVPVQIGKDVVKLKILRKFSAVKIASEF